MIHVPRPHPNLDFVTTKGFKDKMEAEFEAARAYFARPPLKGSFAFDCYKHKEIKTTLDQMFAGKCAYCDSSITHITHGDIEHFRPKSIYWWLACDWHNLLFACEKCNRSGKNDSFPLLNNVPNCKHNDPDAFKKEETDYRLLINPCIEDPEAYFTYDERMAVITPKLTARPREQQMAQTSIDVYKLQRPELVQERQKVLILLLAQIDYTSKAIEAYNKMYTFPKSVRTAFEDRMKAEISALLEHCRPNRQYLGMVRQIVRKFFEENNLPRPALLA